MVRWTDGLDMTIALEYSVLGNNKMSWLFYITEGKIYHTLDGQCVVVQRRNKCLGCQGYSLLR